MPAPKAGSPPEQSAQDPRQGSDAASSLGIDEQAHGNPRRSATDLIVEPAVEPAIELRDVRRSFAAREGARTTRSGAASVEVIDSVSLRIEQGSFVALIGPTGCGKSTLLRIIAGLDRADAGDIRVADREIAYVFQDAHLLPWRTVAQNVSLPLELRNVPERDRAPAVQRALEDVELADAADRTPSELSGGMRMRVSIARALVTRPRLLLMDEPFAALDEITRHRLDQRLRHLFHLRRFTVLFVTHAIFEATFLADRAVVFSRRPARIVHDDVINLPRDRSTSLREEPIFAREAGRLLRALEEGGA
ncbi:MAG: ABC transporter ATP-binding protein [Polyangiales bacterium]